MKNWLGEEDNDMAKELLSFLASIRTEAQHMEFLLTVRCLKQKKIEALAIIAMRNSVYHGI